ncbi:MAG: hypothetical protein WA823_08845 [Candidatus Acidiferrales bacterium]
MSEATPIAETIAQLANEDSKLRFEAARELYVAGVTMCEPALDEWRTDKEFDELLVRAPHEFSPWRTIVGIAVKPETWESIRMAAGSPRLADVPAEQDAREFEIQCPNGTELDIMTSRDGTNSGPIGKFVEKFGEGIQQIEIYVLDVDRATAILHSRFGVVSIYPKARGGADGTRVNFFLAKGSGAKKVLIELVEEKPSE